MVVLANQRIAIIGSNNQCASSHGGHRTDQVQLSGRFLKVIEAYQTKGGR